MQEPCHLYLLPIGGTAMAPLAGLLHDTGVRVSGVDAGLHPPMSLILEELGLPVRIGWDPDAIPPDVDQVVIGNAVPRANPEVQAVMARGLSYTSQARLFGERYCRDARAVVLAGTHGKTTCTALTAHIMTVAGLDPTVMIGGVPRGGKPWRLGAGGWTVVEGDEYNTAFFDRSPKFLHYVPHLFVVNNVEFDHADIYADLDAILAAFRAGVARAKNGGGHVLANASDPGSRRAVEGCRDVVWYGSGEGPGLRCRRWEHRAGAIAVTLAWEGRTFEAEVPLVGRHNLDNALAAISCALLAGISPSAAAAAAATFPGVHRRLELVGEAGGVAIVDDFAHHPTAVALTLEGARFRFPGRRLVAVLEPRSLTAGRALMAGQWEAALAEADLAVLAPVYHRQRLGPEALDRDALARALSSRGTSSVVMAEGEDPVPVVVSTVRSGDVVVCMSSGDFGGLPRRLLAAFGGDR